MSGEKDGQPYVIESLQLLLRIPTSTTAVSWHLKVKDMDVAHIDLGHTKNYSITVSMQKIGSIHKLI